MPRKKPIEQEDAGIEDGMLAELLDEETIRLKKAQILSRLPGERKRLYGATQALRSVEHRAWLAVSQLRDDLLRSDEAKASLLAMKVAITAGLSKPLTEKDKAALVGLEIGAEKLEHELAEMAVEASEKDHKMLNDESIWYASIRKQTGAYVPMERSVNALYDAPVKEATVVQNSENSDPPWVENDRDPIEDDFVPPLLSLPQPPKKAPGTNEPQPMFPKDPKARYVLDRLTPVQLDDINQIGQSKTIHVNGMCYALMNCGVEELTEEAAEAYLRYLEGYTPADDPQAVSSSSVYEKKLPERLDPPETIADLDAF